MGYLEARTYLEVRALGYIEARALVLEAKALGNKRLRSWGNRELKVVRLILHWEAIWWRG